MIANKKNYTSDLIYDPIANNYGFSIHKSFSSHLKYELILKYIKRDMKILDAGCSNGLFVFSFADKVKKVFGIDINQKFLDIANKQKTKLGIKNAIFEFGDLANIPFKENFFDITYSLSVLLLVPDFQRAVAECIRVTKPNGYVILDITGRFNLSQNYWKKWYQSKGHFDFNALRWREVMQLAKDNNLEIIESHALGLLDQWQYLPIISRVSSRLSFINKIIHYSHKYDLDYFFSNLKLFKPLANRWYVVCQKK